MFAETRQSVTRSHVRRRRRPTRGQLMNAEPEVGPGYAASAVVAMLWEPEVAEP
jgi:hypothetical protein